MRALILGSFNPVTNAHINMGIVARNTLGFDYDITYVPASDEYIRSWKGYKEGSMLPADIRVDLLQEAIERKGFYVSTVETNGITDGKTHNTIEYFGFDDTILCLGIDNISQMKKWYKCRELLQKTKLLVFRRKGYDKTDEVREVLRHSSGYKWANYVDQADISSTMVRNCYINGDIEKLKTLVPETTYKYLEENKHVYF